MSSFMKSSLTSPSSRGPSYLSSTSEYHHAWEGEEIEEREGGGGGGREVVVVSYINTLSLYLKAELIERGLWAMEQISKWRYLCGV